ncbi:MAG: thiol-disulfide oxidoreductase DCC family protein [Tabrizicola sp.]|jgi:predicted DCC family thiol-disulfide oxidoreductase YuxK|nr:thiol-disulfide oxidoreductase DCC family protein [Tabrizicola sp.]
MTALPPDLIVFDGVCVLCNGFARFVHRHDRAGTFRFATAQSAMGRSAYAAAGLSPDALDTVLVRRNGQSLQKSTAILAAVSAFGGPWRAVVLLRLVPRPIRDWLYDRIARNRYRLFGRLDSCPLPPAGLRERFPDHGLS